MARPPLRLYSQTSTPQARETPNVRAPDMRTGIGASLARAGGALQDFAQTRIQTDDAIERMRIAREEDDARAWTATTMANVRARASALRRSVFENAQDGWRGAPEAFEQGFRQYRDEAIAAAPTPSAKQFLQLSLAAAEPEFLDSVAQETQRARQSWRVDTVREAVRVEGSTVSADPALYDAAIAQQREVISGLTDIDADARRDLLAQAEEELAVNAVSGLVERNPRGALSALNDPESDGPFARLTGDQRRVFANRAQAELDRRAAEWRASVRDQLQAQQDMLRQGVPIPNPLSPETVANALGQGTGQAWGLQLRVAGERQAMHSMSQSDLVRLANEQAPPPGAERLAWQARQEAARDLLTARETDVVSYLGTQGRTTNNDQVLTAIQSNDFESLGPLLAQRSAMVTQNAREQGTPITPLTRVEADQLRARLDGMDATNRQRALANLRAATRNPRAYAGVVGQLYPDQPGAQLGALVQGRRGAVRVHGETISADVAGRRMLEGAYALAGVQSGGDDQPRRTLPMPPESQLRAAWASYVGEAYANAPQTEAAAYEAFRAYYAGASIEDGQTDGVINSRRARQAAAAATGGVANSRMLLPWGMSEQAFNTSIERGWENIQRVHGGDVENRRPGAFSYRSLGGGRYLVMQGDAAARNREGQRIVVLVGDQ